MVNPEGHAAKLFFNIQPITETPDEVQIKLHFQ